MVTTVALMTLSIAMTWAAAGHTSRHVLQGFHPGHLPDVSFLTDACVPESNYQTTVYTDAGPASGLLTPVLRRLHQRGDAAYQMVRGDRMEAVSVLPGPADLYYRQAINHTKSDSFVVFVSRDVGRALDDLRKLTSWNPRGQFLVMTEHERSRERGVFEMFWKHKILNVLLVRIHSGGGLQVYTYNPFESGECTLCIREVSLADVSRDLCSPTLLNLQRKVVKVSMFPLPPRALLTAGDRYGGADGLTMATVLSHLNASVVIVPAGEHTFGQRLGNGSLVGSSGDLASGKADVAFNSRLSKLDRIGEVEYLYPHTQSYLCAVVPNSKRLPQYQNVFLTFQPLAWLAIASSIPAAATAWYTLYRLSSFKDASPSRPRTLFDTASSFLSVGIPLPTCHVQRTYIAFWLIFSLIVNNAFQGSFTCYLSQVLYLPAMNTLHELEESDLGLFMHPGLASMLQQEEMNDTIGRMHRRFLIDVNVPNYAPYIVRHGNASALVDLSIATFTVRRRQYVTKGRSSLHIMHDKLLPLFAFYETTIHSPFVPRLNALVQRIVESGLFEQWQQDTVHGAILSGELLSTDGDNAEKEPLTMNHLQIAFILLSMGSCVSSITFAVEILTCQATKCRNPWSRPSLAK